MGQEPHSSPWLLLVLEVPHQGVTPRYLLVSDVVHDTLQPLKVGFIDRSSEVVWDSALHSERHAESIHTSRTQRLGLSASLCFQNSCSRDKATYINGRLLWPDVVPSQLSGQDIFSKFTAGLVRAGEEKILAVSESSCHRGKKRSSESHVDASKVAIARDADLSVSNICTETVLL